jgi:transcriptional regulator with XRE-family HTH domain
MMQEILARKLRVLRAERGITLQEAEELTGVTRETLGALEHGQRGAYTNTLQKIAEGYGTTVEDLVKEELAVPLTEAPETGPPQVSREELAAQDIPATDHEVGEVNHTIADCWRLVRGGKPIAYFPPDDVDPRRVGMLIDLVLGAPSIVTPEAAGVVREGMRKRLKAG